MGQMNPPPGNTPPGYRNMYEALNQAAASVNTILATNGDGPIAGGEWTIRPPNTNVEIGVKNAKGTMTYGVMHAALSGLATAVTNYNSANDPMLFQINDGAWGEMGLGYAGYVDANDICVYEITPSVTHGCNDVSNGWVEAFN